MTADETTAGDPLRSQDLARDEAWLRDRFDEGQRLVAGNADASVELSVSAPAAPSKRTWRRSAAAKAPALPELAAEDLTPGAIADGLRLGGALVVRGLLDVEAVRLLREESELQRQRVESMARDDLEGEDDQRAKVQRAIAASGMSSTALRQLIELFESAGYTRVFGEYLGGRPLAIRERLAVTPKSSGGLGWHQDAAFYGTARALNCWIALTPVGESCPSIAVFPRRMNRVVGLEDREAHLRDDPAPYAYMNDVKPQVMELLREAPACEPVLEPGDALLLDQLTLHRTGERPWKSSREVAIVWMFAPWSFPARGIPCAF